jgi:hypothetical protein
MHLSLEDLLAVRDGEAGADAAQHVSTCPRCAAEIERLRGIRSRLAALPEQRPEVDLWPAVRAALAAHRHHRRWVIGGWVAAGLAAALTLAIGIRGGLDMWHEAKLAHETRQVVAESQRLEKIFRRSELEGRVMSGRTAGAVVQLEDRIGIIDARLARANSQRSPSREVLGLWQERVQLLDALVSLQTTRTAYMGL